MGLLIIQADDKSNVELLLALAKKLGNKVLLLSKEEEEDFAFGQLIKKTKTGEFVSRDDIMQKLSE